MHIYIPHGHVHYGVVELARSGELAIDRGPPGGLPVGRSQMRRSLHDKSLKIRYKSLAIVVLMAPCPRPPKSTKLAYFAHKERTACEGAAQTLFKVTALVRVKSVRRIAV